MRKCIILCHRVFQSIDDLGDPQEDPAGVTQQPGTGPQLLLVQTVQESEVLDLYLRITFEEPA